MKHNVGKTDQIIRIVSGIIILGLGFFFSSLWGALGFIPLITGLAGRCPLYTLFGWSTCPVGANISHNAS